MQSGTQQCKCKSAHAWQQLECSRQTIPQQPLWQLIARIIIHKTCSMDIAGICLHVNLMKRDNMRHELMQHGEGGAAYEIRLTHGFG